MIVTKYYKQMKNQMDRKKATKFQEDVIWNYDRDTHKEDECKEVFSDTGLTEGK